jgi:hypothetical protein
MMDNQEALRLLRGIQYAWRRASACSVNLHAKLRARLIAERMAAYLAAEPLE